MLIDSHVHLDEYPDQEVAQVLERARDAGVGFVISAGTTLESSRRSLELSSIFPGLFSGVGIHPMDVREPVEERIYEELKRLATSTEKALAISEVGLDFKVGMPDRSLQYQAFREQIRLARELDMPIVFHSRESHDEALRVLREERGYEVGGVMHYFQADERTARKAIDLGFLVSLARPLLRLPGLQEVAAKLTLESIVLETDAAPQPFKCKREKWTEPHHLRPVAQKLAELKGVDIAEVEAATTRNIKRMLGGKWSAVERALGGLDAEE
jgi:TatD DNase family protein